MGSVWSDSCEFPAFNTLNKDITAEVCIIGGGIAGVLTAFLLKQRGIDTVLIEGNKVCSGVTKDTTAKITLQHNLIYDKLINSIGVEKARLYAAAQKLALNRYLEMADTMKIECNFEEKSSAVYTLKDEEKIEKEIKAAKLMGIDAKRIDDSPLPFQIKAGIEFPKQAQFNPLKFLLPLAKELRIFENTRALDIKDDTVITNRGKIKAKSIAVTTHYPFLIMPGLYFLRLHQERSYVIALSGAQQVDGMFIDEDKNGYSFRNYGELMLLGGGGHRTGKSEDGGGYEQLRKFAKNYYPNAVERYRWSAQDCESSDLIPFIGKYCTFLPNVYVATGFNKWGMTNSMVSAILLCDMLSGVKNRFEEVFSPQRANMGASAKNMVQDGAEAVKALKERVFDGPETTIRKLENGQAGIVSYKGKKAGAYKNEDGKVFLVDAKCPHLGCQLSWNENELSWDCPCHGSRFSHKGELLDSPAVFENIAIEYEQEQEVN